MILKLQGKYSYPTNQRTASLQKTDVEPLETHW